MVTLLLYGIDLAVSSAHKIHTNHSIDLVIELLVNQLLRALTLKTKVILAELLVVNG